MKKMFLVFVVICKSFMATGQQAKLILPIGHLSSINQVLFSGDEKRVITCSSNGEIKIWESASGILLLSIPAHTDWITAADVSPDGHTFVTTSWDKTAKIWDINDGRLISIFKGHSDWVESAMYSPDGKKIVTTSSDGTLMIWSVNTGNVLVKIEGRFFNASFSPDGEKLITAGTDSTAKVWNARTGTLVFTLRGHKAWVEKAFFSPDGRKIATVSMDKHTRIWSSQTGLLTYDLNCDNYVPNARFSADSHMIATTSNGGTASVWDVDRGSLKYRLYHSDRVKDAVFSPDSKKLITVSDDNTAKMWDTRFGQLQWTLKQFQWHVNTALFTKDGNRIVVASEDATAKICDVQSGRVIAGLSGHTSAQKAINFSPDGKKIITGSGNGLVRISDLKGKILNSLNGHHGSVYSASFSYDGTKILTCSADSTAKIWDAATGKILISIKHQGLVRDACFSPDGKHFATASYDHTCKIWDASDGKLLVAISDFKSDVDRIAFSPDGKKLAVTSWYLPTRTWDAITGKKIQALDDQKFLNDVVSIAYSSNGHFVATGSTDSVARIYDANTSKLIHVLKGHAGWVSSVAFSPDNKQLLTGSWDGTAKVWDVAGGKLLTTMKGHSEDLNQASYSPDGKLIATCSYDNTCKLWNAANGRLYYTFIAVDTSDYLVTDPSSRYDGSETARKLLYFTCGPEVIGLDQVKDQLWVPNLADRLLNNETINAKRLSDLNLCNLIPQVEQRDDSGYQYNITPQQGGLGETVLSVNGIEVKHFKPTELKKKANGFELNIEKDEIDSLLVAGQPNSIRVKAYTADNKIGSRMTMAGKTPEGKYSEPPNLYAVFIGISDYKGSELKLKYAAKDAVDISHTIALSARKLLNKNAKEHVFCYELTTGKDRYLYPEKSAIKTVLSAIGMKAKVNDILLIFFAGHGIVSNQTGKFYFLTADASASSSADIPEEVGISMDELTDWIAPKKIKAQKRILIFDACRSGAAIQDMIKIGNPNQHYQATRNDNDAEQIKAIERLNEKSGLFILAASAKDQNAYESGEYAQGLLTYALLKTIKQQPNVLEDGKYLNVSSWLNATEKAVEIMSDEEKDRQEPQIVGTGNFNIGIVDRQVISNIKLNAEIPVLTSSNFQNADDKIVFDNLSIGKQLDVKLHLASSAGMPNFLLVVNSNLPNAYSISGRYTIIGNQIRIKIYIQQGINNLNSFELSGRLADLDNLEGQIIERSFKIIDAKSK